MKALECKSCGATDLQVQNGYISCPYCGSKFLMDTRETSSYRYSAASFISQTSGVGISLDSDIAALLEKCKTFPHQAKKYANLILDIDPDNEEALKYL